MKQLCVLLLFLPFALMAQVNGVVVDSITQKPIPFVNIWVEGKSVGTTSATDGHFEIVSDSGNILVFSAIGYKTRRLSVSFSDKIMLQPETTLLSEALVIANNQTLESVLGPFSKRDVKSFWRGNKIPWIVARYFPYTDTINKTPFIKSIAFGTHNHVKGGFVNLRLYKATVDSSVGESLYNQNILVKLKKGKRINEVNLADLNLRVPENGLFIGVEWLVVEKNFYEEIYHDTSNIKHIDTLCTPDLMGIQFEQSQNSKYYVHGMWRTQRITTSYNGEKQYFLVPAIQLTLSN